MQCEFDIPLANGSRVHARLYKAKPDAWGLVLHDGTGKPSGNGRTLTAAQAKALFDAIKNAKPMWRKSIIWSALGYVQTKRKAVASTMCHPGLIPLHGKP